MLVLAVTACIVWVVYQLMLTRSRRHVDAIPERLAAAEKGKTAETIVKEENVAARVRITAAKVNKAIAAFPKEKDGVFDAVIIGAGCGGMACAATLARIGYRCCVLEQGEEIGGGSHVFVESGG